VGSRIAERRFGLGGDDIEVGGDGMGVEDYLREYSVPSFLPTSGPSNTPTLSMSVLVPPLSHSPSSSLLGFGALGVGQAARWLSQLLLGVVDSTFLGSEACAKVICSWYSESVVGLGVSDVEVLHLVKNKTLILSLVRYRR
jgi:hypothetical protein